MLRAERKINDIFERQLQKHSDSKTVKLLNILYSLIVGLLSGVVFRPYLKYGKVLGIMIGLSSFLSSKHFLINNPPKWSSIYFKSYQSTLP